MTWTLLLIRQLMNHFFFWGGHVGTSRIIKTQTKLRLWLVKTFYFRQTLSQPLIGSLSVPWGKSSVNFHPDPIVQTTETFVINQCVSSPIAKSINTRNFSVARIIELIRLFYALSFQIYPDPDSEKVIMGSLVFCIHHKEGCKWSDELRKLKVRIDESLQGLGWTERLKLCIKSSDLILGISLIFFYFMCFGYFKF